MTFKYKKSILILPLLTSTLYGCGGGGGGGGGSNVRPTEPETIPMAFDNREQINASVWTEAGYTGAGATVAVLDSGITSGSQPGFDVSGLENLYLIEDVDGTYIRDTDSSSITNDMIETPTMNGGPTYSPNTHGFDMSTIIGDNEKGIAKDAQIFHGVISENGSTNAPHILFGTTWGIGKGAEIINVSFDWTQTNYDKSSMAPVDVQIRNAIQTIDDSNAVIVHSAGNNGMENDSYDYGSVVGDLPEHILVVGGVDLDGELSEISDYPSNGSTALIQRFILAPFQSEVVGGSSYGTSGAAANVSGSLALMKGRWSSTATTQLAQILLDTANKDIPGYNPTTHGAGLLDLEAAFSPVGMTSIPMGGASLPMSAASIRLPAGYGEVSFSSAFVDSYGRDFTANFTTTSENSTSSFLSQASSMNNSFNETKLALSSDMVASFTSRSTLEQSNDQMAGVTPFGYDMFRSSRNIQSMSLTTGDYRYAFSANLSDIGGDTSAQNKTNAKGVMIGVGYKGVELNAYSSKEDAEGLFYGANERHANGLELAYKSNNGLALGYSVSQEMSDGFALLKEWKGTTQSAFVRFDGGFGKGISYGFMTGLENKNLNLSLELPQSTGDGSIAYANKNMNLSSQNVKTAAYFNMDNLQTQLFADHYDRAFHVSYQENF